MFKFHSPLIVNHYFVWNQPATLCFTSILLVVGAHFPPWFLILWMGIWCLSHTKEEGWFGSFFFSSQILKVPHGLAHPTEWGRQNWLSATKPTVQVCQLFWERRRTREHVSVRSVVIHSVGENSRYSRHFVLKGEALSFGTELYMWMLRSDATWVDKLAVRWRRNQRASLLSPDSSEIVEPLATDGESRERLSVSLAFILVVTEGIWDDKNGRYASVFVFLFYNISWSGTGRFVCDRFLTAHLPCLFMLILSFGCSFDTDHWTCRLLSSITCAFCQHHSSLEVWAHRAYFGVI